MNEPINEPIGIAEAIRKDRNAGSTRLVAEYRDRLHRAAMALCGDAATAEDLVFRTFEQVVASIDRYREQDAFFGWMRTILLNCYRMSVRSGVTKGTAPSGGLNEMATLAGAMDADTVVAAIDGDILRRAVDRLPTEMREVVVLHYFMDQPVGKIAKILSIAKGTVKSRLYYARLALGVRLGVVLKKPAVALIATGFFIAAAFAATFIVCEHPQMAEVDEPIFMDDSPVPFEEGFEEPQDGAFPVAAPHPAGMVAPAPPPPRAKSAASLGLKDFSSSFRDSQSRSLPSFNSTAPNPVAIMFR